MSDEIDIANDYAERERHSNLTLGRLANVIYAWIGIVG